MLCLLHPDCVVIELKFCYVSSAISSPPSNCDTRLGLPLPDAAHQILNQELRFKKYQDELQNFLEEFNNLPSSLPQRLKPLLETHINDLDRLVRPGILSLTWQSMNIDGYLHRINGALKRLLTLISNLKDLMTNTIDQNLLSVRKMVLVHFPDEGQFLLDEFVAMQQEQVKRLKLKLKEHVHMLIVVVLLVVIFSEISNITLHHGRV